MARPDPRKRKSWFIILLLFAIALGYTFYFQVYVRSAEERLYNKGEFVLEDIINNIHELDEHYQESAKRNFRKSILHFILVNLIEEDRNVQGTKNEGSKTTINDPRLSSESKYYYNEYGDEDFDRYISELIKIVQTKKDTSKKKKSKVELEKIKKDSITTNRALLLGQLRKNIQNNSKDLIGLNAFSAFQQFDSSLIAGKYDQKAIQHIPEKNESFFFYGFQINEELIQEIRSTLLAHNCIDSLGSDELVKRLMPKKITEGSVLALNKIMGTALRTDFFENVVIFNKKNIYYQLIPGRVSEPVNIDTLIYLSKAYDAGVSILDLPISGRSKKMFLKSFKLNNDPLYIAGTRDLNEFTKETRGLNYVFIMFFTFLFLLLLSIGPTVKLYVINAYERLSSTNVVMTGLGFFIGLFAIPTVLSTYINYSYVKHYREHSLVPLSNTLQDSIVNELNTHYQLLIDLKSSETSSSIQDAVQLEEKNVEAHQGKVVDHEENIYESKIRAKANLELQNNFNEILFISEDGIPYPLFSNTANTYIRQYSPSVKKREYFTAFDLNKAYKWKDDPIRLEHFYVGAQFSKTMNKHESSLSISLKGKGLVESSSEKPYSVLAVTGHPNSLIDVVMPHGYGFYLIQDDGNVLFSSERNNQFNEDLKREADPVAPVLANIQYGATEHIEFHYQGRELMAYITPIDQIVRTVDSERPPLYLITWYDKSLVVGLNGNAAFQTAVICMTCWLLIVLLVVILQFMHGSDTRLKRQINAYRWLFPSSHSRDGYELGTFVYGLQAVLLAIYASTIGPHLSISWLFFLELILFSAAFNIKCIKFTSHFKFRKDKTYVLALKLMATLLSLFIIRYFWNEWNCGHETDIYARFALYSSLAMHLLLLWFKPVFNLFRSLASLFKNLYLKVRALIPRFRDTSYESNTQRTIWWYRRFILAWVICVAVFPSIIAFKVSFLTETLLLSKYDQVEKELKFDQVKQRFAKNYDNEKVRADARYLALENMANKTSNALFAKQDSLTIDLSKTDHIIRGAFRQLKHEYNGINYPEFSKLPGAMVGNIFEDVPIPSKAFRFTKVWSGLIVGVGIFLFIIFLALPSILNRLFTWRVSSDLEIAEKNKKKGSPLSTFMQQVGQMHADADAAYLTAMPSVDIVDWVQNNSDRVKNSTEELEIIDLENKEEREGLASSSSKAPLLLKDFTIDLHDIDKFTEKVQAVRVALAQSRITTFVHANLSIGQLLLDLSERANNSEDEEMLYKLEDLTTTIERMFSNMRAYIIPMRPKPFQALIPLACHYEFAYGANAELALGQVDKDDWESVKTSEERARIKESIILKAQRHLKPFYLSIWNALNKKERYVVYDLCEDGFINIANRDTVYLLVDKGVLRLQNESIVPFNESFRNFVLTNIDPAEALEIELLSRTKGSWGMIKLALILFAVALVAFLFLINQSSFDKALAIITGGVGLLTVVGRLFTSMNFQSIGSMFSKGGK